jgi:hypothetical protein
MREPLSARPLHALVRFRRLQFPPRRTHRRRHHSTRAAPDGEQTATTDKADKEREGQTTRAASSTTRARFITEQLSNSATRNLTPGISGAHRRLRMRSTLSARPLHASVRFRRLQFTAACRRLASNGLPAPRRLASGTTRQARWGSSAGHLPLKLRYAQPPAALSKGRSPTAQAGI